MIKFTVYLCFSSENRNTSVKKLRYRFNCLNNEYFKLHKLFIGSVMEVTDFQTF